jgi:hypothetical protein
MAKKDIETIWDDVRLWLTDATKTALKEAEDLTRRGRLKMDLMRVSREIERKMADFGARVHGRLSKAPDAPLVADEELKRLMQEIARLESELAARQKEYEAEKQKD